MPRAEKDEAQTREEIDEKLVQAGWLVQDAKEINLAASLGVAVREEQSSTGPVDYALYIDGKLAGVLEAKREGTALGAVAEQSARYASSVFKFARRWVPEGQALPFIYEATNNEIRFRNERDPHPRSRNLFHFHRPATLKTWLEQPDTLRARLQGLPALDISNLRNCQIDAIHDIEKSLKAARPRALLQMATGSGKTYAAVAEVYRLAKYAKAGRILFLVDRGNLARQALKEFQRYTTPDDQRKFSELYNVHILGAADIGAEIKVTISTIQRLYAKLTNNALDETVEEHSAYEADAYSYNTMQREVSYNPSIPIEAFDLIIIDECHRSIYKLWRQVLEYFDAFLIGLTATPTKQTIGYFNQNLVSEYSHEDAVIDKVNVGYDVYSIRTKKTVEGDEIEAGLTVQLRDKLSKKKRWEVLDETESYSGEQIDRSVIAPNQIRKIIQTFKGRVFTDIFHDRTGQWLPKALIFAKDDDHADRIVDTVREVFDEANDFCKKVTYRVGRKTAEDTIAALRTNPRLRVGVTVDMIATGTDIKPLEILMFMRDVKSPGYYEQMKGRGTRTLGMDELRKVTPDARVKSRFVLIDCVGVSESDKTETKSLESRPHVPTAKLMQQIARGDRSSESLRTLGNRLLRIDLKLEGTQKRQLNKLIQSSMPEEEAAKLSREYSPPTTLAALATNLIYATNDERLIKSAGQQTGKEEVSDEEIETAFKPLADSLIYPFHNPDVRELLEALRRDTEQIIDESADELIHEKVGYTKEKAEGLIRNWREFIQDHKDELDAIQLIYQQPYHKRHLSHEQIQRLAEEIEQPPYNLAPIEVWRAYEQLEKNKVKGVPPRELLTNIVSLIRFSTGLSEVLEPFSELVNNRFENWLRQQDKEFQPEQLAWLNKIKDQTAQSAEMTMDDFDYTPFIQDGGLLKAKELFGKDLEPLIEKLNCELVA